MTSNHDIHALAERVLERARQAGLQLVTAESCTGGLLAATLTDIPGASDVFERGFVTYAEAAKRENLGVDAKTLANFGAVSAETAEEMAAGALAASPADIAVAITGIAGPGGGTAEKPVGLVWFAVARRAADGSVTSPKSETRTFPDTGRMAIRRESVKTALTLIDKAITGRH